MENYLEEVYLPSERKAYEKVGKVLDKLTDMIDFILRMPVEERKKHVGLFVGIAQIMNNGAYRSENERKQHAEELRKEYLKQLEEY